MGLTCAQVQAETEIPQIIHTAALKTKVDIHSKMALTNLSLGCG